MTECVYDEGDARTGQSSLVVSEDVDGNALWRCSVADGETKSEAGFSRGRASHHVVDPTRVAVASRDDVVVVAAATLDASLSVGGAG